MIVLSMVTILKILSSFRVFPCLCSLSIGMTMMYILPKKRSSPHSPSSNRTGAEGSIISYEKRVMTK